MVSAKKIIILALALNSIFLCSAMRRAVSHRQFERKMSNGLYNAALNVFKERKMLQNWEHDEKEMYSEIVKKEVESRSKKVIDLDKAICRTTIAPLVLGVCAINFLFQLEFAEPVMEAIGFVNLFGIWGGVQHGRLLWHKNQLEKLWNINDELDITFAEKDDIIKTAEAHSKKAD
jgi:hypothetical protein